MKTPCNNCPFRKEGIHLSENRKEEIKDAITHDGSFSCYKTIGLEKEIPNDKSKRVLCTGSAIWLEQNVGNGVRSNVLYRLRLMGDPRYWDNLDVNLELKDF